jgi:hypothetical protein
LLSKATSKPSKYKKKSFAFIIRRQRGERKRGEKGEEKRRRPQKHKILQVCRRRSFF